MVLYSVYSAWGILWQLCWNELCKVRNRPLKLKKSSLTQPPLWHFLHHTTPQGTAARFQSDITVNRWIGKTRCYYDLYTNCKCSICPDIINCQRTPPPKPYLFIGYYTERVEIHKGIWKAEGDCQPLSLTVNETSATPVLQKVHLKHTINFPIADVTFYCPLVSGFSELAGSAALLSKPR